VPSVRRFTVQTSRFLELAKLCHGDDTALATLPVVCARTAVGQVQRTATVTKRSTTTNNQRGTIRFVMMRANIGVAIV